jgi:hypothetical protein
VPFVEEYHIHVMMSRIVAHLLYVFFCPLPSAERTTSVFERFMDHLVGDFWMNCQIEYALVGNSDVTLGIA